MKINQTVEVDIEQVLVDLVKSTSEEYFAQIISNVMKRAHNPLESKTQLLKQLERIN